MRFGQLRQVEGLVGGDGELDAGQIGGRVGRPPVAIRTLSAVNGPVAVGAARSVWASSSVGAGVDQIGAGVLQVGDVDAREPGDLDVLGLAGRPAQSNVGSPIDQP